MFDLEHTKHILLSTVGALILTTTLVGAAVGPARAVETAPIGYAGVQHSDRVNA